MQTSGKLLRGDAVSDPSWNITLNNNLVQNATDTIKAVAWYLWANPTVSQSPPQQFLYLVKSANKSILQWIITTSFLGNNPSCRYMTVSKPHGYFSLMISYIGTFLGEPQTWCIAYGTTQPDPGNVLTSLLPGYSIPVK